MSNALAAYDCYCLFGYHHICRHVLFCSLGKAMEALCQHSRKFVSVILFSNAILQFAPFDVAFVRYTAMSCATSALHRTDRLQGSNVSSARVHCVTEMGDLHIVRISAAGISLEHVIPSMRMVMSGVPCNFEMILAVAMEVRVRANACFYFSNNLCRIMTSWSCRSLSGLISKRCTIWLASRCTPMHALCFVIFLLIYGSSAWNHCLLPSRTLISSFLSCRKQTLCSRTLTSVGRSSKYQVRPLEHQIESLALMAWLLAPARPRAAACFRFCA
jgi:hypothetical protein